MGHRDSAPFMAVTAHAQQEHVSHRADPAGSAELFPHREASGTAWVPDITPMFGIGRDWHGWTLVLHGRVFGQVLIESSEKHRTGGASGFQLSSVNWGMLMARRAVAGGRLGFRTMLSAEPWTVDDCGFLNLLATGEICEGDTIHDRQHPHDLAMELAVDFDRELSRSLRWQVYAGLAGTSTVRQQCNAVPGMISPPARRNCRAALDTSCGERHR